MAVALCLDMARRTETAVNGLSALGPRLQPPLQWATPAATCSASRRRPSRLQKARFRSLSPLHRSVRGPSKRIFSARPAFSFAAEIAGDVLMPFE